MRTRFFKPITIEFKVSFSILIKLFTFQDKLFANSVSCIPAIFHTEVLKSFTLSLSSNQTFEKV